MAKVATVFVDRGGNKVMINASDYDPEKHSLWGVEKPSQAFSQDSEADIQDGGSEAPQNEWESLANKLVSAGLKRPHPNTKLKTLQRRVDEL